MLNSRSCMRTTSLNLDFQGFAGFRIEFPNMKIVFENDLATVVRNTRPHHSTIRETRQPFSNAAPRSSTPDILGALLVSCVAPIGNVEESSAIGAPHGPELFSTTRSHAFVSSVLTVK